MCFTWCRVGVLYMECRIGVLYMECRVTWTILIPLIGVASLFHFRGPRQEAPCMGSGQEQPPAPCPGQY